MGFGERRFGGSERRGSRTGSPKNFGWGPESMSIRKGFSRGSQREPCSLDAVDILQKTSRIRWTAVSSAAVLTSGGQRSENEKRISSVIEEIIEFFGMKFPASCKQLRHWDRRSW